MKSGPGGSGPGPGFRVERLQSYGLVYFDKEWERTEAQWSDFGGGPLTGGPITEVPL